MVNGLKEKPYKEQLTTLGLVNLEKTESRAHHRQQLPPKGQHLLSVTSDRTQGSDIELCQGGFRLDIRKRFLT